MRIAFNRSRAAVCLALFAALLVSACSHDIDAIKRGTGNPGAGLGGGGAGGTGASGTGMGAVDAGFDAGSSLASCEPCVAPDPVGTGALTVTATACCYGTRGRQCGVGFGTSATCYPPAVAGAQDSKCQGAQKGGMNFPGCCRPDGQCGVVIDAFGLGCVADADVPKLLGGPLPAKGCVSPCTSDDECKTFSDALICVEDASHNPGSRFCARDCARDADCEDLPGGLMCVLFNNQAEDRVDQLCRKPFGSGVDKDPCTRADDCEHGTCIANPDDPGTGYCTRLCGGVVDCSTSDQVCAGTNIQTPVSKQPQPARICKKM